METKTLMDSFLHKHHAARAPQTSHYRAKQHFLSVSQPLKKPYRSPVSQSIGSISEIPPIVATQNSLVLPRKDYPVDEVGTLPPLTQKLQPLPSIQRSPLRQTGPKDPKSLSYYQFKVEDLSFDQRRTKVAHSMLRTPSTQTRQSSQTHIQTEPTSHSLPRKGSQRSTFYERSLKTKDRSPLLTTQQEPPKRPTSLFPPEQLAKKPDAIEQKLRKDPVLIRDRAQLFEIHCIDQQRKMKYDFYCDRQVLSTHIHYFKKQRHMKQEELDDLDISIYCEVKIFSWLMKYVRWLEYNLHKQELDPVLFKKRLKPPNKPQITKQKCLSLLVSSHFLTIPSLVEESARYVTDNLQFLLKHRFQFDLISKEIIKRLAGLMTIKQLFSLQDPRKQLKHRLFQQKLEELLTAPEARQLYRCVYCNRLFTLAQREWMACDEAKIFIDFHGNVIAQHVADRDFDMHALLMHLREKRKWEWEAIFWNIYALFAQFDCALCGKKFVASEIQSCAWHPEKPCFTHGSNVGKYQCCGKQALRFSTAARQSGCQNRLHQIAEGGDPDKQEIIESVAELLSEPEGGRSRLHEAMLKFMKNTIVRRQEIEEDEDEQEEEKAYISEESGDDQETKKVKKYLTGFQPRALERMEQQRKAGQAAGQKPSFQQNSHVWRTDCIRDDDKVRMEELTRKLAKCRCKESKLPVDVPSGGARVGVITSAGILARTTNGFRRAGYKQVLQKSRYGRS